MPLVKYDEELYFTDTPGDIVVLFETLHEDEVVKCKNNKKEEVEFVEYNNINYQVSDEDVKQILLNELKDNGVIVFHKKF